MIICFDWILQFIHLYFQSLARFVTRCRTAIRAHFGPRCRRDAACHIVGSTDGERGHQFFDFSLTKGAFYLGFVGRYHPIKFIVAVFTIVFIYRHDIPPIFSVDIQNIRSHPQAFKRQDFFRQICILAKFFINKSKKLSIILRDAGGTATNNPQSFAFSRFRERDAAGTARQRGGITIDWKRNPAQYMRKHQFKNLSYENQRLGADIFLIVSA